MEYTINKGYTKEILRLKYNENEEKRVYNGWSTFSISQSDCDITDEMYIENKISEKDEFGFHYDFYEISSHVRMIDKSKAWKAVQEDTDKLTIDHEMRILALEESK